MPRGFPRLPYGNKEGRHVPPDILRNRTYETVSWDQNLKVFRQKVLAFACPYCLQAAQVGCISLRSGAPKKGPYAAGFHMDRVYLAYPDSRFPPRLREVPDQGLPGSASSSLPTPTSRGTVLSAAQEPPSNVPEGEQMNFELGEMLEELKERHDTARNMIPHNHRKIKAAFDAYADYVEEVIQYLAPIEGGEK